MRKVRRQMASDILTPEEEEIIREQSKRCSLDTKQLLAIIQRLVELIEAADANKANRNIRQIGER